MDLQPITFDKTDELRDELRGYDQRARLIDGLTAAASLSHVINVAKIHGAPTVLQSGMNASQGGPACSVQERLF